MQLPLAPPAGGTPARPARGGVVGGIHLLIGRWEGGQELLKLPYRQPSQSQELSAIALECRVC